MRKGFAFFVEGATELCFYKELIHFLCRKHEYSIFCEKSCNGKSAYYVILGLEDDVVAVFSSISLPKNADRVMAWLQADCYAVHPDRAWPLFACLDTDAYSEKQTRFSKEIKEEFHKWRKTKSDRRRHKYQDMLAVAEIEDVFLFDKDGILRYLGIKGPYALDGRNGKAKLQHLYKQSRVQNGTNVTYKEGEKAEELIKALDMQKLIDKCRDPRLEKIEELMFV